MTEEYSLRRKPKQERGQQRVDEILVAAAELLQEVGYEGLTTSLIAERANTSVGSLYQFFANKEQVLHALAERYLRSLEALNQQMFTPDVVYVPIEILFSRTVDMLVDFAAEHPGMRYLFSSPWVSSELVSVAEQMNQQMSAQIRMIMVAKAPELDEQRLTISAEALLHVVTGMLAMVGSAPEQDREIVVEEFKRIGLAYWQDIIARGTNQ